MIAQITGNITYKDAHFFIIDVHGIGYKVRTLHEIARKNLLQKEITLFTHLAVREDALDLYGFKNKEELGLFEKLITVSGIGPKSALAILNLAPIQNLIQAISSGDAIYLTKVSGIGKKSAAKIILELKDTITYSKETKDAGQLREEEDALDALVSLGYGTNEARNALRQIKNKHISTGETIKEALKLLSQ